eukprot:2817529-Pyramimonas_sp.AAC.1
MISARLSPLGEASRRGASPRLAHAATNASLPGDWAGHFKQHPKPALTAWYRLQTHLPSTVHILRAMKAFPSSD